MSKKHLRDIAIVIIVVFLAIIIVYPLIYGPDQNSQNSPPPDLILDSQQPENGTAPQAPAK